MIMNYHSNAPKPQNCIPLLGIIEIIKTNYNTVTGMGHFVHDVVDEIGVDFSLCTINGIDFFLCIQSMKIQYKSILNSHI